MIYAAYGSNFGKEQMKRRVPNARPIEAGWITCCKVVFRGDDKWGYFADLKFTDDPTDKTLVFLYEMDEEDFALMDKYEQVAEGRYYRKEIDCEGIYMPFCEYRAIVYKMREDNKDRYKVGRPSYEYIGRVARGLYDRRLPMSELKEMLDYNEWELRQ